MTFPAIQLTALRFAWPGQAPLLEIDDFCVARGEKLLLRGPVVAQRWKQISCHPLCEKVVMGIISIAGTLPPSLEKVDIQAATANGQSAASLTRQQPGFIFP